MNDTLLNELKDLPEVEDVESYEFNGDNRIEVLLNDLYVPGWVNELDMELLGGNWESNWRLLGGVIPHHNQEMRLYFKG